MQNGEDPERVRSIGSVSGWGARCFVFAAHVNCSWQVTANEPLRGRRRLSPAQGGGSRSITSTPLRNPY